MTTCSCCGVRIEGSVPYCDICNIDAGPCCQWSALEEEQTE